MKRNDKGEKEEKRGKMEDYIVWMELTHIPHAHFTNGASLSDDSCVSCKLLFILRILFRPQEIVFILEALVPLTGRVRNPCTLSIIFLHYVKKGRRSISTYANHRYWYNPLFMVLREAAKKVFFKWPGH